MPDNKTAGTVAITLDRGQWESLLRALRQNNPARNLGGDEFCTAISEEIEEQLSREMS
jgi:hypothetical protein